MLFIYILLSYKKTDKALYREKSNKRSAFSILNLAAIRYLPEDLIILVQQGLGLAHKHIKRNEKDIYTVPYKSILCAGQWHCSVIWQRTREARMKLQQTNFYFEGNYANVWKGNQNKSNSILQPNPN